MLKKNFPFIIVPFFCLGIGLSTWITIVPGLAKHFDLTAGQVGWLFFMLEIGCLTGMQLTSHLIANHGHHKRLLTGVLLYAVGVCVPGLVDGFWGLLAAIGFFGLGFGSLDIAANARAEALEKQTGKGLLGICHATFSMGAILGSLLTVLAVKTDAPILLHLSIAAFIMVSAFFYARHKIPNIAKQVHTEKKTLFSIPGRALLPLVGIAIATTFIEGAISDFGGLYLQRILEAPASLVASFYAVFSCGMLIGRLNMERLLAWLSPPKALRLNCCVLACGVAVLLYAGTPELALFGIFLCGLGQSYTFPLFIRAAARTENGNAPARNIAAIISCAYIGFMVGPPALGMLADHQGLSFTLHMIFVAVAVIVVLAGATKVAQTVKE